MDRFSITAPCLTSPSFCTTLDERVYITATGCEIALVGTGGALRPRLWPIVRANVLRDSPVQHHVRQPLRSLRTFPVFSPPESPNTPACTHQSASACAAPSVVGHRAGRNHSSTHEFTRSGRKRRRDPSFSHNLPRGLCFWHIQPFASPDPLHAIFAHLRTAIPQ